MKYCYFNNFTKIIKNGWRRKPNFLINCGFSLYSYISIYLFLYILIHIKNIPSALEFHMERIEISKNLDPKA